MTRYPDNQISRYLISSKTPYIQRSTNIRGTSLVKLQRKYCFKNKLFNLLEYEDLLDEVVDEEWEGDQVDRYLNRNRKDLFQMDDKFKLGSGL
uniref:Uncharacterized protein n=1 Tax=Romanomermis culicivorax TaxID=13658 RepID=A0A915KJE4_ROMCU